MSHLLIVTPLVPPEPGGPSYYSVALKKAFEAQGHEVRLIAFREVRGYPSGVRHVLFFWKVLRASRGVDALIVLDTVSVALPAVFVGWLRRKQTIVRVGGDFVWERYVERTGEKVLLSEFYTHSPKLTSKERLLILLQKHIVCRLATTLVYNTGWQRDLWEKPYSIPKEKTGVIENAFTKSTYEYKGGDTFLCVWRPTAFKNTDTLEVAYRLAKEQCPDITLAIHKNISREELFEHMKYARALIIPSLTELSPNMALEALGMGLPVLLTQDCGAHDLLEGKVTWIDPRDPHDIAQKMIEYMDESVYKNMKEKMATQSLAEHTYEQIAKEFLVYVT